MSEDRDIGCEDRHDDLAAYSLGALGEDEAARLEAHLGSCESCTERLGWLRPAVQLLPASVPQEDPPPALGERLMAIVREEAAADPATSAADTRVAPATSSKRRWRQLPSGSPLRPALAGLATLALIAAGAVGYAVRNDGSTTETFAAQPIGKGSQAAGTVTVGNDGATISVDGLDPLEPDRVYQVWIARGKDIQPSEVFVLDHDGHGSTTIPELDAEVGAVLVTEEPAGGSEVATTAPVLRAKLD